jgi:hypothetical protein
MRPEQAEVVMGMWLDLSLLIVENYDPTFAATVRDLRQKTPSESANGMPACLIAVAACSREEPVPKL